MPNPKSRIRHNVVALDIGGANLKAADGRGYAASRPFALWAKPERLAHELRTMLAEAPPCELMAVTMTGELADCFESKAAGVRFILDAAEAAAGSTPVCVYQTDGRFATPAEARRNPLPAAASNWRALAEFALRFLGLAEDISVGRTFMSVTPTDMNVRPTDHGRPTAESNSPSALLIDIGSTTTDVIPLIEGRVGAEGLTDTQRLLSGELVYAGVGRTPVCSLVETLPYRGRECPIAREFFVSARDVYLLLGDLLDEPQDTNTADGRPATKAAARVRLARMICADGEEFDPRDARRAAEPIAERQLALIATAVRAVIARTPQPPATILVAGEGEFLARRLVEKLLPAANIISLAEQIGAAVSRCAPAHALAVLAKESLQNRD